MVSNEVGHSECEMEKYIANFFRQTESVLVRCLRCGEYHFAPCRDIEFSRRLSSSRIAKCEPVGESHRGFDTDPTNGEG